MLEAGAHASYALAATDQTPLPTPGYPFQFQLTSTHPEMLAVTPQLTLGSGGALSP